MQPLLSKQKGSRLTETTRQRECTFREKEGDAKARLVEKSPKLSLSGYLCVFADGSWIGWEDVRWKCNKKAGLVRF
jgi:hypothetical protein